jgi:hypothetical protein
MKRQAHNVLPPPVLNGPRITEMHDGCELFLGTESERGAMVQEDLFVGPPMQGCREFAAANLQAESYLEREHNARRTAPGVAHATTDITANVLTLLFAPQHSRVRPAQSLPTSCAGQRGGTMASGCRSQCQASQRNST